MKMENEVDPCDKGDGNFYDPKMHVEVGFSYDDKMINVILPSEIYIYADQARRFAAALIRAADFLEGKI